MRHFTFSILLLLAFAGCGSESGDSRFVVVSNFPATSGGTGASFVFIQTNAQDAGKVDLVYADGSRRTCEGSAFSETSFYVDEAYLNG